MGLTAYRASKKKGEKRDLEYNKEFFVGNLILTYMCEILDFFIGNLKDHLKKSSKLFLTIKIR